MKIKKQEKIYEYKIKRQSYRQIFARLVRKNQKERVYKQH